METREREKSKYTPKDIRFPCGVCQHTVQETIRNIFEAQPLIIILKPGYTFVKFRDKETGTKLTNQNKGPKRKQLDEEIADQGETEGRNGEAKSLDKQNALELQNDEVEEV